MKKLLFLHLALLAGFSVSAQNYTLQTFKDTRVINSQATETLAKRKLDVRISHRFGDLAGDNGGFQTFFGLESVADVLIGAEYGISDNWSVGLFRAKGAGVMPDGSPGLRQLMNGTLKYRILRQKQDNSMPVSVALLGVATGSAAQRVEGNPELIASFPKFIHRFAWHGQLIVSRKFSDGFSLQLAPGYTYRNLTPFGDAENGLLSLSVATRVQLTKVFALIADATVPFSSERTRSNGFYPALGLGLEIDTGGHVFQVNFTNATGLMETDYIPYTTSNWLDGQFRLGFTISRLFNL